MRDALAAVDAREPGLIARFGGHAMAAGLSLAAADYARFAAAFDIEVRRVLDPAALQGERQALDDLVVAVGLVDALEFENAGRGRCHEVIINL